MKQKDGQAMPVFESVEVSCRLSGSRHVLDF
jgi:hypothetical protein